MVTGTPPISDQGDEKTRWHGEPSPPQELKAFELQEYRLSSLIFVNQPAYSAASDDTTPRMTPDQPSKD
jgi:hypothetical protein